LENGLPQHVMVNQGKNILRGGLFHQHIQTNPNFFNHVWFSDEAHFLLPGQ